MSKKFVPVLVCMLGLAFCESAVMAQATGPVLPEPYPNETELTDPTFAFMWIDPFYEGLMRLLADLERIGQQSVLNSIAEGHTTAAATESAALVACEAGIFIPALGPPVITLDFMYECYLEDQQDLDNNGVPDGVDRRLPHVTSNNLPDAVLNVLLQSGPGGHPIDALEDLKAQAPLLPLDPILWLFGD